MVRIDGLAEVVNADDSKQEEAPDLDALFLRVQELYKVTQQSAAQCCKLVNTVCVYRSGNEEVIASTVTAPELAMLQEIEGHLLFQRQAIEQNCSSLNLDENEGWVREMRATIEKIDKLLPSCHPEPINVRYPIAKCVIL